MMVTLDRGDYWQCAFVIAKGGIEKTRADGLPAFRARIIELAPHFADRVQELQSWDDIKLLTVSVNRLRDWSRAGLLVIGDAAHAMSPVGGVGINLAVQDAVAAANILGAGLRQGAVGPEVLRLVQRRRETPTRLTQRMQILIQNRVISRVLASERAPTGFAGTAPAAGDSAHPATAGAGDRDGVPAGTCSAGGKWRAMTGIVPSRRALISVSDKTGLVPFAQALAARGVEILSTGGSARALRDAGVPVKEVSEHTGFPEILDGRVKTLVPQIHGGILGRRDSPEHLAQMEAHGIAPIDLVVVNLYPFEMAVAQGATEDVCIETIDIGGPALMRAAAKNHAFVAVVTEPDHYGLCCRN